MFETSAWAEIETALPLHSRRSIACKGASLKLYRFQPARSHEAYLRAKREGMRRYRDTPDGLQRQRESQRRHYYERGGAERQRARNQISRGEDFFVWRAKRSYGGASFTAMQLRELWERQRGICGLTGKELGPDAELDHIVPRARGGSLALVNVRWVTPQANRAKRDMLDEEFLALCLAVGRQLDCSPYPG